jgi:colanic acid biosynthesis protein WcaH
MASDQPIPPSEYQTIAKHVPVVSVDLLVHHAGGIVFGKRQNEPAKGEWFVPGGTVLKGETRCQAVHRVAREELGVDVTIEQKLGVYDHFYEAAASDGIDSKQYLATAYVVTPISKQFEPDDQHTELRTFDTPFPELHDYVQRYVNDLRKLGYEY